MGDFVAEKLLAAIRQALAAGTPAMREEFLRLAAMYEILASRTLAQSALSAPPPAAGVPE